MPIAIQCRDLRKTYDGKVEAVKKERLVDMTCKHKIALHIVGAKWGPVVDAHADTAQARNEAALSLSVALWLFETSLKETRSMR